MSPIGIFDSGYGGLTILHQMSKCPLESSLAYFELAFNHLW